MLKAHLDPTTDAASRRPERIDAEVEWLVSRLGLRERDRVLDLGCGPGLYCTRLAQHGLEVTGVDYSETSIAYARAAAVEQGLSITYRIQDYLTLDDQDEYTAVFLIYGDFCVLSDEHRAILLERIRQALRPGGYFVFDAMTPAAFHREEPRHEWEVRTGGFWRPAPHLLLTSTFLFPDELVVLRQYGVMEEESDLSVYRVWSRYYSPETITDALELHGFVVEEVTGDLTGTQYSPDSEWFGIIAQKRQGNSLRAGVAPG